MNQRKLLLHQRVEVRQFEEGLRGSWHPGVVVGVSDLCRRVEYDELLSETGDVKLIESISVTEAIEGLHRRRHVSSTYRGRIRPPPSLLQVNSAEKLGFGVCVDAWFEDAWWEGVLFDCDDDASERSVFFPDEGDERKFSVNQLRVAHEWDEFLGVWKDRGIWILVQLARDFEGDVPLCKFIKKVWCSMRLNYGFRKMISEWPCGVRSVWSRYFMDVVYEIAVKSSRQDLCYLKILSFIVGKKGNKSKGSQQMKLNSYLCDSLVQVRNHKIVSYKVRKKGNKLKDSQHSKLNSHFRDPLVKVRNQNKFKVTRSSQKGDKLNSHIHDPLGKVRNQNEFRVTRSSQKGEDNSPYGKCNKKKQSSGSKSENEKQSITNTAELNGFKYNNLCRGKQMTTGPSFIEHSTVGKGVHGQIANDDSGSHKVGKFVSLPTQKKPGGVDFKVEKLNSLPVCEGGQDKVHVDSSRGEQINTHGLQNVLNYKLVKRRRNLTKRNFNKKLAMVFSECLEKQKDKKLSLVVVHKRKKRSIMKRRKLMKSQQIISKIKSPPKVEEQGLYTVQTGDDLFSNHCCPTLPIEKYGKSFKLKNTVSYPRKREMKQGFRGCQRDTICSVCHYGGDLIFCDHCPSSYHLSCLDLKDFPGGNWFCPSCCCGLCGLGDSNDVDQQFTNICMQCMRRYHMTCLSKVGILSLGIYPSESFCSEACFKLCSQLHQLLGISNPTTVDGLTWTLMRSMKNACYPHGLSRIDSCIKLSSVLRVIHDCFEPVKEPHTKRDLVRDVVFNSTSKLKRLDFHGFYSMVLHRGDEIVSVATVRIHGLKVAEMPLVATPFQYRRQGMCRLLVHEFEKLLIQLGVERLVLPSILQLQKTWEDSFGFSELLHSERSELFGYPFLVFQGTKMLQKCLSNSMVTEEISGLVGTSRGFNGKTSGVSVEHKDEGDSRSRYSGVCYKRKSKRRITGKENMINSCNGSSQRYGYVYKRRRILCSRD